VSVSTLQKLLGVAAAVTTCAAYPPVEQAVSVAVSLGIAALLVWQVFAVIVGPLKKER